MKERSAQECIKRILRDIDKRRNVDPMDYADRSFVRRYNAAMDRILKNAHYLWEHYPDQRNLFIELACSSDYAVASHFSCLLYGMTGSTLEQKMLALSIQKELLNHPDADGLSIISKSMVIKAWEAELAEQSK